MRLNASLPLAMIGCLVAPAVTVAAQAPSGVVDASQAERPSAQKIRTFKRVRSEDTSIRQAIADGYGRSQEFRRLVDAIDRSDLLLYVSWNNQLSPHLGGTLHVRGKANGQRIVSILISREVAFAYLIPMMAHELQHAVEVADAPSVVDQKSLFTHYQDIGTPGRRPRTFDTAAARAVEVVVSKELHGAVASGEEASSGSVADGMLSGTNDSRGADSAGDGSGGP